MGQIFGAAGDSCIVESAKSSDAELVTAASKAEAPGITLISDVALPSIPSEGDKISSGIPTTGEGDVAVEAVIPSEAADEVTVTELGITAKLNGSDAQEARFDKLQEEVQKRTGERDNYEKKLAETEKKLSALQAAYDAATSGKGDEMSLRRELEDLKNSLVQTQTKLNDRGRLMANQENQINALTKQVSSLKEVVAITKNLLEIRNMEVKHLQDDVDSMENRITAERERHNAMLRKMDAAVRLNADLKTEYETQLRLFQDLRGKYEEKVTLLTAENKAAAEQAAIQ